MLYIFFLNSKLKENKKNLKKKKGKKKRKSSSSIQLPSLKLLCRPLQPQSQTPLFFFFEKATDLLSNSNAAAVAAISADDAVKLLLDVNLARSRTAWELLDQNLAVALLSRSKTLLLCSDH